MRGSSLSWTTALTSTPPGAAPLPTSSEEEESLWSESRRTGPKTTRSRLYGPPSGVLVASEFARLLAMTSIRNRCAVSAEPAVLRISSMSGFSDVLKKRLRREYGRDRHLMQG